MKILHVLIVTDKQVTDNNTFCELITILQYKDYEVIFT